MDKLVGSILGLFMLVTAVHCQESHCLPGQKQRTDKYSFPICCWTVTCRNMTFVPCGIDGEMDQCRKCPDNECGIYTIKTELFTFPPSDICQTINHLCDTSSIGGTLVRYHGCKAECLCNRRLGFYRYNPQTYGCVPSGIICRDESTQLTDNGKCEPCSRGHRQDKYGNCAPQRKINTTAKSSLLKTTISGLDYTDNTVNPEVYQTTDVSTHSETAALRTTTQLTDGTPAHQEVASSTGIILAIAIPISLTVCVMAVLAVICIRGRTFTLRNRRLVPRRKIRENGSARLGADGAIEMDSLFENRHQNGVVPVENEEEQQMQQHDTYNEDEIPNIQDGDRTVEQHASSVDDETRTFNGSESRDTEATAEKQYQFRHNYNLQDALHSDEGSVGNSLSNSRTREVGLPDRTYADTSLSEYQNSNTVLRSIHQPVRVGGGARRVLSSGNSMDVESQGQFETTQHGISVQDTENENTVSFIDIHGSNIPESDV